MADEQRIAVLEQDVRALYEQIGAPRSATRSTRVGARPALARLADSKVDAEPNVVIVVAHARPAPIRIRLRCRQWDEGISGVGARSQGTARPGGSGRWSDQNAAGCSRRPHEDFTPGTYVLLCFVPADTDGKPHFMHGMQQEIIVQ